MALRKEYPFPQFKVASYKSPGIRLSFEDTTTLLPGGREREEWLRLRCLQKCSSSVKFLSRVLSKIVANQSVQFHLSSWQDEGQLSIHKWSVQPVPGNLKVLSLWIRTPWCIALKNDQIKNFIKRQKTLFFNFHLYSHLCFADWFAVTRIYTGVALSLLWAPSIRLSVNNLDGSILILTLPYQNLLWLFPAIWVLSYQSAECSSEYFSSIESRMHLNSWAKNAQMTILHSRMRSIILLLSSSIYT